MKVAETLEDLAGTSVGTRYHNLFLAHLRGEVTLEQLCRICYGVMQQFWRQGEYRTNRPIPSEGNKQIVRDRNAADADKLEQMTKFKAECGLEMTPEEDAWYSYLLTGVVSAGIVV